MTQLTPLPTNLAELGAYLRKTLGYPLLSDPVRYAAADLDLPQGASEALRGDLIQLMDLKPSGHPFGFQVWFLPVRSLRRREIRTVLEPFCRRYPQNEYLFLASDRESFQQLVWISPKRSAPQDHALERPRLTLRYLTVEPASPSRTDLDILNAIRAHPHIDPQGLWTRHDSAFDVTKVTDGFFRDYERLFRETESAITGIADEREKRLFTQKLFNRLMFVRFLERKGWARFNGRNDYLKALWQDYHEWRRQAETSQNFYSNRLKRLFFDALNTPNEVNVPGASGSRGALQRIIGDVPYLNGGLFEPQGSLDDDGSPVCVPDHIFPPIWELFYNYNFTVTESTPLDIEVAVDPEMLGRIFEQLVTGRHETGAYYTPRPVVSFMCKEALKGYLKTRLGVPDSAIEQFAEQGDPTALPNPEACLAALKEVKICDPACGSGAYLLGMMELLVSLREALFKGKPDSSTRFRMKLDIIRENIYGVDIDPVAVNIARLRLWLALVIDDDRDPLKSPTVDVSLPNLDFKIQEGDSLLAPAPLAEAEKLSLHAEDVQKLGEKKEAFFWAHGTAKERIRKEIEQLKQRIRGWTARPAEGGVLDWLIEFPEIFVRKEAVRTFSGKMPFVASVGQQEFLEYRDLPAGFDIVITNPPYVSSNRVPAVHREAFRDYIRMLRRLYGFGSDLYVHFIYRALDLVRYSGVLFAITSDTYLTNTTKEHLRRHLLNHTLRLIMPLSPDVFGAVVQCAIIGLQKGKESGGDHEVLFLNLRDADVHEIASADTLSSKALKVRISDYERSFSAIFFEPTAENRALFSTLLSAEDVVTYAGRSFVPLQKVAPALDTGIDSGNVRHSLLYKQQRADKQLPKLIQGVQVVRYGVWWENPKARFYYVDVDYKPNPNRRGIGRGGKPSGRREYWKFRGPKENHHVTERLLMRQTEDEPFVGYIYQGGERLYTDNTVHTLLLTDYARKLGLTYRYLLALLNSTTLKCIYQSIAQEEGRTLAQVKTTLVNRLPIAIPTDTEREKLESLVARIQQIQRIAGFPLPADAAKRVADLEREIDARVSFLYRME
jgi:hypothetical protein